MPSQLIRLGTNLSGADLSDADLSDADLSDAYLTGANLSGAKLEGTLLVATHLKDSKDLTDGMIKKAFGDNETTLPDWPNPTRTLEKSGGCY